MAHRSAIPPARGKRTRSISDNHGSGVRLWRLDNKPHSTILGDPYLDSNAPKIWRRPGIHRHCGHRLHDHKRHRDATNSTEPLS